MQGETMGICRGLLISTARPLVSLAREGDWYDHLSKLAEPGPFKTNRNQPEPWQMTGCRRCVHAIVQRQGLGQKEVPGFDIG